MVRVRVCGTLAEGLRQAAAHSGTHMALAPVLASGRIELLHYLREQAVSYAYHRYGSLHDARLAELSRPPRANTNSP